MAFNGSFKLGPFSVDPEGLLSLDRPDVSPGFSIRWRGRVIHARLMQNDASDGHLFIQSSLGRIPSSASDPSTRVACFTMFQDLLRALPNDWNVRLLPDHQPQLEVQTMITLPIAVTNLVTELTTFLLRLAPYLDVLDHAGLGLVAAEPEPSRMVG